MPRYAKKAQTSVKEAMHRKKRGTLLSGKSGKKVTSRKQAIAIGLSEAREKGVKVPPPPKKQRATSRVSSSRNSTKTATRTRKTFGRAKK